MLTPKDPMAAREPRTVRTTVSGQRKAGKLPQVVLRADVTMLVQLHYVVAQPLPRAHLEHVVYLHARDVALDAAPFPRRRRRTRFGLLAESALDDAAQVLALLLHGLRELRALQEGGVGDVDRRHLAKSELRKGWGGSWGAHWERAP